VRFRAPLNLAGKPWWRRGAVRRLYQEWRFAEYILVDPRYVAHIPALSAAGGADFIPAPA
jgi:hypothetical protein